MSLFRASAPLAVQIPNLGPLAELPGKWVGKGFNLISLPDKEHNSEFRIKLNATHETTTFAQIGGPVPDRGTVQDDIMIYGVHYLQQISDAVTNAALHLEPGLWLNVPATTSPAAPATIVRQGTVPHGDSFLAQGTPFSVPGGPTIPVISSTPIKRTGPPLGDGYFGDPPPPIPPGIPDGAFSNPNLILTEAIKGQNIVNTVVLQVSTDINGGVLNIPFVINNANVTRFDAIYWIETVQNPDGSQFMQLQYSQTVNLEFLDIDWPHISVATLIKQ